MLFILKILAKILTMKLELRLLIIIFKGKKIREFSLEKGLDNILKHLNKDEIQEAIGKTRDYIAKCSNPDPDETGTRRSITKVANKIPIPNEIAIGLRNKTCVDWLNNNGAIPKKVVRDVRITGLNLDRTASITAVRVSSPFSLALFTKTTKSKLSFTTTPERATTPNKDKTDIG